MAEILRAAGLKIEVHDDHFRQDAVDPEWLTTVGEKNWIVVTRDERIRYRVAEKQAIPPRESTLIRSCGARQSASRHACPELSSGATEDSTND
jgi:hypothetical protein